MAAFDPAAATAAYLATLSPAVHAKAQAYTQGGHWLLLWGWLVLVLVALVILRSNILAGARDRLERRRGRPWLVAFVLAAIYSLADWLLALPWSIYANWWREKSYGLTSQPLGGWLAENAIGAAIGLLIAGVFFTLIYALIRKAPRLWPLWAGALTSAGFLFLLFVQPIFIEPLFNSYTPAPPGATRDLVVAMGKQVGVPTDKILIYDGSKQSNRYTANVAGLFGTARVAMSDVMFTKGADLAEVRAVVGHEMGHYVRGHIILLTLFAGVVVAAGAWLVGALFPWALGLVRATRVGGLADPAGLPVLMILAGALLLLATPLTNAAARYSEADADHFSLAHFNEPDGLARALVKTIEYRAATPSALEEALFYDHPSVGRRVRAAMDWKATHPASTPAAP